MTDSTLGTQVQNFMAMQIDDEFVVVSLRSGKFLHFNPATERFIDFFREPRELAEFVQSHSVPPDEIKSLEAFSNFLIEEKILAPVAIATPTQNLTTGKENYARPQLIRVGEKNLSECEFSYP